MISLTSIILVEQNKVVIFNLYLLEGLATSAHILILPHRSRIVLRLSSDRTEDEVSKIDKKESFKVRICMVAILLFFVVVSVVSIIIQKLFISEHDILVI